VSRIDGGTAAGCVLLLALVGVVVLACVATIGSHVPNQKKLFVIGAHG
jgi:hypothetical protein